MHSVFTPYVLPWALKARRNQCTPRYTSTQYNWRNLVHSVQCTSMCTKTECAQGVRAPGIGVHGGAGWRTLGATGAALTVDRPAAALASYYHRLFCAPDALLSSSCTEVKAHNMRHTGEKPHQCNQCDYPSTRSSDLKQHKSAHHWLLPAFVRSRRPSPVLLYCM